MVLTLIIVFLILILLHGVLGATRTLRALLGRHAATEAGRRCLLPW